MPRPNGRQFVTLYRGLADVSHPDEIDPELIGPHWTHDKERAFEFAGKHGSVVEAQIPQKHILYNGQTLEEHPDFNQYHWTNNAVYRVMPDMDEAETFVRPGVPIRITGMETHYKNPIRDKWTFEKPLVRSSEKLYGYSADKEEGDITEWYKGES